MSKYKAILFDFDGVIANTEPLYDKFTDELAIKYNLGIEKLSTLVKGTTNKYMIEKFFNHLPDSEIKNIYKQIEEFESVMAFPPVNGVLNFIGKVKNEGYRIGLVTSSPNVKMERALRELKLEGYFDSEVTENRITKSKPDPMCYLLAASDLNVLPSECLVFEDSFHGIEAAKLAGMKVIGLSTSIPKKELINKTDIVISDFTNIELLIELI